MQIQILGTGCPKCSQLAEYAQKAVQSLGLVCDITKVTDFDEITRMGVFMTPALAVDGHVLVSGKVPSVEELQKILAPYAKN